MLQGRSGWRVRPWLVGSCSGAAPQQGEKRKNVNNSAT